MIQDFQNFPGFNRTLMELKGRRRSGRRRCLVGFNRTLMELKALYDIGYWQTRMFQSNPYGIESGVLRFFESLAIVSIEPLWN